MLWTFLIIVAIAIGLIQLGALSVWVAVMSLALKAILVLLIVVAVIFLWRRFKKP